MKKKSLVLTLTAVVLALALGVGGTLAYFSAKTDNVVNTFTVGNVAITLDEAKVKFENDAWVKVEPEERVQANTYSNIYPGASLPKDPTIHVAATSQKAWVAMKVVVTEGSEWATILGENADLTTVIKGYDGDKWDRIGKNVNAENNTIEYLFIYNTEVSASANLTLFTKVDIPATLTGDQLNTVDGFTITATGYALQAQGVNFETAKTEIGALAYPQN